MANQELIWVALAVLALAVAIIGASMGWLLYRLRRGFKAMQEQISGLQIGYGQLQQDMRNLVGLKHQVEVTRGLVSHVAEQVGPLSAKVDKLCRQDDIDDAFGRLEGRLALLLARQGVSVGTVQTGGGGAAVGGNVDDNRARTKRRKEAGELPREEIP